MHSIDWLLNLNELDSNERKGENDEREKQRHQSRLCFKSSGSFQLNAFWKRFCYSSLPFATLHSIHAESKTDVVTLIVSYLFCFDLHESY